MRSHPERVKEVAFGRAAEEILYHYHVLGSTIDRAVPGADTAVWRAVFRFHNPKALDYNAYREAVSVLPPSRIFSSGSDPYSLFLGPRALQTN
jgi:hypothetical protein